MRGARPGPSSELPLRGYPPGPSAPLLDQLSDEQLARLNAALPWNCFTVDSRGRRFGDRARAGKRENPQVIPDERLIRFHESFDLSDKHVLEVGCFEGIHTVTLCQLAQRVTAVDHNVLNVAKTAVRCAFYDVRPTVQLFNLEEAAVPAHLRADAMCHIGVLYHLRDPVGHLRRLHELVRGPLLLDTHVATAEQAAEWHDFDGHPYRYWRYPEGRGFLGGAFDHAKWLLLDDVVSLLGQSGFGQVDILDQRSERNGERVTIHASGAIR